MPTKCVPFKAFTYMVFRQMECAQINIKGGKASASPQTYSIPGIYKVRQHSS